VEVPAPVPADALAAARRGEGWAFEGIYTALGGPVRRFVAAQGAPDPEATTQEVFVRVFRRLDRFVGDAHHLRSWVFTVARNLLVDERRAGSRRPDLAQGPVPDRPAPRNEDDLVAALDDREVRRVLDQLPADQREVVVLRYLVDLPLAEVSVIVGRSTSAVKALQHRGLVGLRRRLEDPGAGSAPSPGRPSFSLT
jgi:RNA polymerase sigma-70 factor (ECF subfamily)